MSNFGMVGKLFSEAKDRDSLIEILNQAAEMMNALEDCHLYVVSKDADDETAVWVMELWESKEAHDQSLTKPEVRDLIGKAMPMLKGNHENATLIPVSGTSK